MGVLAAWSRSSVTMGIGVAIYVAACIACVLAWRAAGRGGSAGLRRFWAVQAGAQLLFAIDIRLSMRHELSRWLREVSRAGHWHDRRHLPQVVVSWAVGLAMLLAVAWLGARCRRGGWKTVLAIAGSACAAACFTLSVISLHEVDAILYHRIGPTMAVALAWVVAGGMVIAGAMWEVVGRARKGGV